MFIKQAIFFIYYTMISNPNPSAELYITGNFNIDEDMVNENIRIINSYDNYVKNSDEKDAIDDEKYHNEQDIKENVEITIDNVKLNKFSYFYIFTEKGPHTIKYSFKKKLKKLNHLFYECRQLTALDFSHYDTSDVTQVKSLFGYCESLGELNLSNFYTHNVTNMEYMFCGCGNLKKLDLSKFNTKNVTDMKYMFFNCYQLEEIKGLLNFDTKEVTNMHSMFGYCESLKELKLSSFNTKKVTDMGSMFSACHDLKNLDTKSFETESVTNMDSMFSECSSLKMFDLQNFNTKNVTSMNSMFRYCNVTPGLTLPKFNTKNVTDFEYMFQYCSLLTTLNIPNFIIGKSAKINLMFTGCFNLRHVYVNDNNTSETLKNKLREDLEKNTNNTNRKVEFVDLGIDNNNKKPLKDSNDGNTQFISIKTRNLEGKNEVNHNPEEIRLNGNDGEGCYDSFFGSCC